MFGFIVAIIIIIIVGVGGATLPSNGGPSGNGCDRCKALPSYWKELTIFEKSWMSVYMFWLWVDCKIRC